MYCMAKRGLLIFFSVLLTGCYTVNPPEYRSRLNRIFHFENTYYVYQIKDWRPWLKSDSYHLRPINTSAYIPPNFRHTLQEYLNNKTTWRKWHNDFDVQYRIVGIIDK